MGEQLIHDVYYALRNAPAWDKTLLIVTYDEHGGCYDHVPPPETGCGRERSG
jgi:phospholipase C